MRLSLGIAAACLGWSAAAIAQSVSVQTGGGQSEVKSGAEVRTGAGSMKGSSSAGDLSTSITVGPGGQIEGKTGVGNGKLKTESRAGGGSARSSSDADCPEGTVKRHSDRSPDGRSSSSSVSCEGPGGSSSSSSASGTSSGSGGRASSSVSSGSGSSSSSSSSSSSGPRR